MRGYSCWVKEDPTRTLVGPGPSDLGDGPPGLEILEGPGVGRVIELGERPLTIGRTGTAELSLNADGVSRKHAKVSAVGDGHYNLIDLGSTNGTFLNGRRIEVSPLREGDRIQVGQVTLRFGRRRVSLGTAKDERKADPLEALSAREREVAELVAEGLTNAQIGKRLHISGRTVSTHLVNIYQRLEIHSRAALARFVAERGMAGRAQESDTR